MALSAIFEEGNISTSADIFEEKFAIEPPSGHAHCTTEDPRLMSQILHRLVGMEYPVRD
jgi:hypothetical protein